MSADIKTIGNDSKLETILNQHYAHKHGHFIEVGPEKIIQPGKFERYYEAIKDFEVYDDDVFVLAFPKTGSRWTQEMIWLLLNNLDFEKARELTLQQRSPVLELEAFTGAQSLGPNYIQSLSEYKRPRCIGSHLHWTLLPNSIKSGAKKPKIIVVLRGPEDVCTSYYHQAKFVGQYTGTFDEFCQMFLGGKIPSGPYWKHVLSFWNQRDKFSIKFIKYNEMKSDLPGTIRNLAGFLGKTLSDDEVAKMCEHLVFDNLKNSQGFNMEQVKTPKEGSVNPFIRSGTIGDHKNFMTSEMTEAFEKQKEQFLAGTGLTVD